MEAIIAVLFIVFMLLVDWRLAKIHKELKVLNANMGAKQNV